MTRPVRAFWQAIAALFLLLAAGTAHAAFPPRPTGPVLDQANIIPDADEAALTQKLAAYTAQTGRAVIVATVASLDGQEIDTYGPELGQTWGAGGKETDQGLILLVAPNERKVRIEVGYGLEEYMPDVLAGRIIAGVITPRFKAGDYPGGIDAGIDQILTQLNRNPADAKAVAEAAAAAAKNERSSGGGATIASAIFWVVMIVVFLGIFGRGKGGHRQRRSGIDPGIVLWGLSELARSASDNDHGSGGGWGGGGGGGGGGGFGGFGGGGFGGGGASGGW